MASKTKREPKLHLIRRQNPGFSYPLFVRFVAIVVSFVLIIGLFTGIGGFQISETIEYFNYGSFGNDVNTSETFRNMMYLLILAIGLAPAYKMKYWNTGALGQALIGNLCSAVVIYKLGPVIGSNFLLLIVAFIAAIAGGAIWGIIPGFFKAKFNANETLFTLMTNYVATKLCEIVIEVLKGGSQHLSPCGYGKFDTIGSSEYAVVYIIVAICFVGMFVYLKYTKHGYELTVVGESVNTAKYAGIDVAKVTIRTAAISGAICAICGFIYTGVTTTLSTSSDAGYGFTSIIVTWSSHFSLVAMGIIAFLIAFIKMGSDGVKNKASNVMNGYAAYISIGIFLLFLIGCEFFLNFKFVQNSEFGKKYTEKKEKIKSTYPTVFVAIDSTIAKAENFAITLLYKGKVLVKGTISKIVKKNKKEEK